MIDLSKLSTGGKMFFLAYDQGLEHGPSDFNDENMDPSFILKIGLDGGYNAVIFQKGITEKYYLHELWKKIPLILKLNGKTNLTEGEPYSPQLCSVDEALQLGAKAVGYTIYVGSEYEAKMFSEFSKIEQEAHGQGLPVMAWMYPRGRSTEGKDKTELTSYAARIGLELGADIVKIQYPGSVESLKKAVESAGRTKVVVSGGKKETEEEFIKTVQDVMRAGAAGLAVGRNVWQNPDPIDITIRIKDIIFGK